MRIRSVFSHSAQAIAEGALISLLAVGLLAGSAFAARGGGGKPAPGTGTAATCAVNPSSVSVGQSFAVSGTGYHVGAAIDVKIYRSTATEVLFAWADASGSFSASDAISDPDHVRIEVWEGGSRKWALKCSTSVDVTP